ncbi:MAG: type II toxin-antitoxin system RelB/DinJ family antitoxin [Alkalibacterium sp.]|nr:type II toxin-antitoxin system RelB/DinJ family antitoxin [Alkalibacterium sp.]
MSDSRLNVRIDKELKEEADRVYKEIGNEFVTTADYRCFTKQSVNDQSMPFKPNLNKMENMQARYEAEHGQTEKFNSVEDLWTDLNED